MTHSITGARGTWESTSSIRIASRETSTTSKEHVVSGAMRLASVARDTTRVKGKHGESCSDVSSTERCSSNTDTVSASRVGSREALEWHAGHEASNSARTRTARGDNWTCSADRCFAWRTSKLADVATVPGVLSDRCEVRWED